MIQNGSPELFIHTIRSLFANLYLVESDSGIVIVDAGFVNATRRVLRTMDQLGYAPNQVRLIFLTHAHMDHIGSAAELRRETGAPIAMHRADVDKTKMGQHNMPTGRGTAGKIIERVFNDVGAKFKYEAFEPDLILQEGQGLDEFGLAGRVLETPGHTLGSISLELSDGVMLIGDAMINQIRVGMPLYGEDNRLAYDSLRKIYAKRPRILYSGHGKPFSGQDLEAYFDIKGLSAERVGTKGEQRSQ